MRRAVLHPLDAGYTHAVVVPGSHHPTWIGPNPRPPFLAAHGKQVSDRLLFGRIRIVPDHPAGHTHGLLLAGAEAAGKAGEIEVPAAAFFPGLGPFLAPHTHLFYALFKSIPG